MGVQGRGSMPDLPLANCKVIITYRLPCARYSHPLFNAPNASLPGIFHGLQKRHREFIVPTAAAVECGVPSILRCCLH